MRAVFRDIAWDALTPAERARYLAELERRIRIRRGRISERTRLRGCGVAAVAEVCGFPFAFVERALADDEGEEAA